ncbi:glycosyltransferase family 4 protein [Aquabacterium sp. OR-4]|uniref:glycosyltransferase family 4 protein n=1 Tax=Aquabacterium sp. OR-4 TaxID=2978127 RepID=UPI0028CA87BB|nr:glycosyltransferase family 4 protein [Aquabacterium sp. OR-4]MDT7837647.1 glycosyltransferase family 4 protein [Aquabacterium sp. OR-4]
MSSPDRSAPTPARPARILMYTAYFAPEYSGAALQALTLARELRGRGHQVEFVTNRWPGLDAHCEVDGFQVQRLQPGRMRKHREFRLWFNLARYVWSRRHDFDVLHSHGAYFTNAFIGPLARLVGMKSLIKASLARDDLQGLGHPVVGRLHQAMLRSVDACVAISHDLVEEFRVGGLPSAQVHHVSNGVDTARFQALPPAQRMASRQQLGLPDGRRIALFVGVLDQRKNIAWLAEQWVAHQGFGTGALLLAVGPQGRDDGDGALRRRLAALAAAQPQWFVLHDFHADVLPYYQAADVLILPSYKEGLPNVVLEAMACGLPCVAARTSGSRELIDDGRTGWTYAPDQVDELAVAVQRCLSDAAPALGAAARQTALERYAIGAVATRYEAIYTRLLGAGAGAGAGTRVLYVENGIGYGGAIICLRHLVRNLDRQRFDPMVITGLGDSKYQDIAGEAKWRHIPDRRVDVVSMKRRLAAATWPDAVPGLRWATNQVLARLDDVCNFLPSFLQTLWTVLRFRPALIHVNNEPLCNRAAILAGKLMRVPVVAHVRGDQQGSLMMHSFFKLPDYFIAVSRWVSDSIGRIGVPERARSYIYDGIELDKLDTQADGQAFRARHGLPPQAYVVGLVGLLIPWKGQRLFFEAMDRLAARLPDVVFAIVGGTPDECQYFEAELRQLAEQPHLKGRVVFTGHVSQMAQVYNGLDVVLSASTSPEPLGTMIIEAMTMARPILAPNHGGAVEMIDHGRTGLLFAPGDADDLAAKIAQAHDDPAFSAALGQAARAQALRVFAISEHVRQVESVYARVLSPQQVS